VAGKVRRSALVIVIQNIVMIAVAADARAFDGAIVLRPGAEQRAVEHRLTGEIERLDRHATTGGLHESGAQHKMIAAHANTS